MRRSAIERLLPTAYQQAAGPGTVLTALLDVMEQVHTPSEQRLADVAELFSPYRTPDEFVRFLAGWVAVDHVAGPPGTEVSPPVGRLRDLVAEGAGLAQWRGTAAGLKAMVEIVTGVPGFAVEESPERPFHVVVRVPAAARPQLPLIERVVEVERPAAVTFEVVVNKPRERKGVRK
jgi:phage tail-like protein